ncbi:MAG: branched-chain amino acid ABC transporter permease [Clostridia bacterium]|nr:branched-chain amino acid ABC transporter permease [Clostridia bacterium]
MKKSAASKDAWALGALPSLGIVLGIGACLLALGLGGALPANGMRYLFQIFLYITLGEAWNLLGGYAGLTSLGQQLFIGLSGYAIAVVTGTYRLPLWLGVLAGALLCALGAYLLSFVLFRMHGMYFAVATWVAAEAMSMFFFSWKYVNQGGGMTMRISPYPTIHQLYPLALILCCLALTCVTLLLRSRLGLSLMAMRDDPEAAAAAGVNLRKSRLIAYLASAVLTALAGGLFFVNQGTIYPDSGFQITWTVSMVFIVIIGGSGTVGGPVVGAVVYVLLREYLAAYPGWSNIILGAVTILVILFLPAGIVGTMQTRMKFELFSQRRHPKPE